MTEVMVTSVTGGAKGTKPERMDLLPGECLMGLSTHYGIGSAKYDDDNWMRGYDWKFSYAALQRHATAWWGGEEWTWETFIHRDTGEVVTVMVNHMLAVAWHAFALYYFSEHHREFAPKRFAQTARPSFQRHAYLIEPSDEYVKEIIPSSMEF